VCGQGRGFCATDSLCPEPRAATIQVVTLLLLVCVSAYGWLTQRCPPSTTLAGAIVLLGCESVAFVESPKFHATGVSGWPLLAFATLLAERASVSLQDSTCGAGSAVAVISSDT
jgi:hypothetical protein